MPVPSSRLRLGPAGLLGFLLLVVVAVTGAVPATAAPPSPPLPAESEGLMPGDEAEGVVPEALSGGLGAGGQVAASASRAHDAGRATTGAFATVGSDDYERTVDITFPVVGPTTYGRYDYHQDRDGGRRKHQSTDLMAGKMQRIHAAMGGTVQYMTGVTEPMPSWGYGMAIHGDDGLRYVYLHINNDRPGTDDGRGGLRHAYAPGVTPGGRVERGQFIAYVGDSGAAETTPPHLHFQIHDEDLDDPRIQRGAYLDPTRLDPWASLQAADARGDYPGRFYPGPTRVARVGSDEVGTAVALSPLHAPAARTVVVVAEKARFTAAVASPLAAVSGGVVLPTGGERLDPRAAAEVSRSGARNAYLLGDETQLSPQVEADLRTAGVSNFARIAGTGRYDLAARVAEEVARYGAPMDRVFLVRDRRPGRRALNWQDAAAVSGLAAMRRAPILLASRYGLPDATVAALARLRPKRVVAVGSGLPDDVVSRAMQAGASRSSRLPGDTVYETSASIAEASVGAGMTGRTVFLASGRSRAEVVAAGPVVATANGVLLLVDGQRPGRTRASERWLRHNTARFGLGYVLGGQKAVSRDVARHLRRLLNAD